MQLDKNSFLKEVPEGRKRNYARLFRSHMSHCT